MIAGRVDVLWVGATEPREIAELPAEGVVLERTESVISALGRVAERGAGLVVVAGDLVAGREAEAFASLRLAGARSLLAVYPPALGWRAERALGCGADEGLALPVHPGRLRGCVVRLLRGAATLSPTTTPTTTPTTLLPAAVAAPAATLAVPARPMRARAASPVEGLVGDIALIHRTVGDLERLLDQVITVFRRRSGATRVSVMLLDEARTELSLRRSAGFPDGVTPDPVPVGRGFAGHVARTGLPLLVTDVEQFHGEAVPAPLVRDRGAYRTRSFLVLPLRGSEGVIGVMCLADRDDGVPFEESDLPPLAFLADQAGQAIDTAVKYRRLQELAAIDELTGLSNRRQFQQALEREIQRARRYDRQLTLTLIDLDHFKNYNDLCGHPAGDRALAAIGEILRTSLREVDVVARYGGEEFAVILPETAPRPQPGARNPFPFLERLRRRVADAQFEGQEKLPDGRITLSGGVACFPDDAETLEDLVREADRALYVSKARGRNTITYRGRALSE